MLVPMTFRSTTRVVAALLLAAALGGCAAKKAPAIGQAGADKFLYDEGTRLLAKKNWVTGREYYRRLVDSYPQSPYRADAKLGIAESYLGENRVETRILAINEYREFLTYYPTNPRADYAQYRLGLAETRQMLHPERDQTNTIEALDELQKFLNTYPNSEYRPEVDKLYRQARDRLSESEFRVGLLYYRAKWIPGALARFGTVLKDDPGYSKKDEIYFYIGEAFMRAGAGPQALPYFDRLLTEFPDSKYVKKARRLMALMKAPK